MTRPTPLRSSLRKRKKPDQETETDPGGTSVKSEKQRTVRSSTDDDRSAIKVDLKQDVVVLEDEADFSPKSTKKVRKMVIVESDVEEEKMKPEPESNTKIDSKKSGKKKKPEEESECRFIGEPIPLEEARRKWPERYIKSSKKASARPTNGGENDVVLMARCHYLQAEIENCIYNLKDDAYVKAVEGKADYIGRIVEIFETVDGQKYFTAQWFFRAEDTAIKFHTELHDVKRVFLSNDKNDNPLNCIVKKIKIVRVASNLDLIAKAESIPPCDLYYDMSYSIEYTTFAKLPAGEDRSESSSTISSEDVAHGSQVKSPSDCEDSSSSIKPEASLLDLYSGCGAMSTGLCLGARLSGLNLQTRWAVDLNPYACESLKLNHPHTEVRNEMAEDFLALLREWEKLCHSFSVIGTESSWPLGSDLNDDDDKDLSVVPPGEFEVEKIIGICYGDPSKIRKTGIKFKVRWKGYGPSEDTWEPIDGLSKCQERIEDFVKRGYKSRILPLPGDVDVICGGPPCQGISGFNRFRNSKAPLEDPKNRQMLVFMDIVNFLKPKYVLMENVVDILKFAEGYLGRYAISRLVSMNYQTRLGMMVAGCYGLPQFRMRVFLWGARPNEILPQFPLPTHDVVVRGGVPNEFEQNMVAYDEHQPRQLVKALLLGDAISDLPQVMNNESRDEMPYGAPPKTIFQQHIRSSRVELGFQTDSWKNKLPVGKLFDHRPLQLNNDDYQRVCQIPKKKGANFRDLPGVRVGADKVVEWDPSVERVYLPSGKPLVPDYAMSFIKGKSLKPFARLWWDETVPTVVTRAEPHNQAIIHPEQDRVLTIRENARLQGFPDFYKFSGPIKERYIQVGNAVAVPVSTALGYALAQAFHGIDSDQAVFTLPPKFPSFETYTEAVETDDNIV